MSTKTMTVRLDAAGVDSASEAVQRWLEEADEKHAQIIRARLTTEELLLRIAGHFGGTPSAELCFQKGMWGEQLLIRYRGERFDPTDPPENEIEEWSSDILARIGYSPSWRYRFRRNELVLRQPGYGIRGELVMLGSIVAAAVFGFLSPVIPAWVKTAVSDYALVFLAKGILGLLNTFLGLVIFLSVLLGICGIGNAAAFGRIGKLMVSRFLAFTFLLCGVNVLVLRCFFPLRPGGVGSGGSQLQAILELLFGILPGNPIRPFLEGNTLQIMFLATLLGVIIMFTGSRTEELRNLLRQVQAVVNRAVSAICVFLPVYIFSSLVLQIWSSGSALFLQLWKPLLVCALLSALIFSAYLAVVCVKLKVRASVLLSKLLPDFLIGLSTASSASALTTTLEINEKKLGIAPELSRTGTPIGGMLNAGSFSLIYLICGVYLAEQYGIGVSAAWWVTLWIVGALLAMANPPVAGGTISCLTILIAQLGIPEEGLAMGVVLSTLLDFLCTGTRIPVLHMELVLQADRLGLLDRETLRQAENFISP